MAKKPAATPKPTQGGSIVQEQSQEQTPPDVVAQLRPLEIPPALTVHDLAALMDVGQVEVIKEFMRKGYMLTVNQVVEQSIAGLVAPSFGFTVLPMAQREKETGSSVVSPDEEDPSLLKTRPPVVTILGHVDHGKTTLLDAIRHSNLVDGEAGKITQHIGAYQVDVNGNLVTFLDTPGHEAFTAMRARGAQVTDIAVLVVAADDGIMPQTVEAINHAKAASVPIMVAINKVDKPDADQERVKRQLSEHDLLIEEWGGEVIAVPVSALAGEGISELLENVLVLAEVRELKANPDREARGVVVEARTDKSRGTVATVLVHTGTLRVGDHIVVGDVKGRVKAMFTDRGIKISSAPPSHPAEILGISSLPQAGATFVVVPDEKAARQMMEENQRKKQQQLAAGPTLEDVHARIESGEVKALSLIVKTDVQGTIEPVRSSLEGLTTDQTRVDVIHAASGSIAESDVMLAVASGAIIIGFNSRPEPGARTLANHEGVEIRFYDIIYHLVDDVDRALQGLLEPVFEDVIEGQATVRAVFPAGKRAKAAGFYVNDGRIARDSIIHVMRNGKELFVGAVGSLKHFKDDAREVTAGFEGGLVLDRFDAYREDDVLEAHRSERTD